MNTHHRHSADRAERRTTSSWCRSAIAFALAVPFLAAACGSDLAADPSLRTPTAQQPNDIVSETVGAMAALSDEPGADDEPDYTAAELEVLLDVDEAEEVLDGSDPEPLDTGSPEAAIKAVEARLDDDPATGRTPILDQIEPVDDGLTGTIFGVRDGRRINEVGEANRLDEAAALACGNVEIALTALDDGRPDKAADHLQTASAMASNTTVSAMTPWSPILDRAATVVAVDGSAGDEVAPLIAFLDTCTQGGYEL
ncbi:MAG: hypothetical protein OEZ14_03015 [Acidimicrobiia bacterium]|nr:hypothetical protein [Acidimicrobiia bacterium]